MHGGLFGESKRAKDTRFLGGFIMEIDNDKAVVAMEGGDKVCQIVGMNAAA